MNTKHTMNDEWKLPFENELIFKYFDKSATEKEKSRLLEWLKNSEENRLFFSELNEVWIASIATYGNDISREIALDKLKERIQTYQTIQGKKKKKLYTFLRIAAIAILAFSLNYFGIKLYHNNRQHNAVAKAHEIINQVIVPDGGKTKITLPDGTTVWLNSNSKLKYPEQFSATKREVTLEGNAYFDVIKNKEKPFIVHMDEMSLTVLGTSFEASNYGDETLEAVLLSGSVQVKTKETEVLLKPNEKVSYSKISKKVNVEDIDAGLYCSWANDKLTFDNATLEEIIPRLERWYQIKITCPPHLAKNTRISFTLRNEQKEQLFRVLATVAPIKYRIEKNNVTIYN